VEGEGRVVKIASMRGKLDSLLFCSGEGANMSRCVSSNDELSIRGDKVGSALIG
jgi:hypothetical protein